MRLAGKPPGPSWDKIAGVYRTGDGRYVRLHTNFPHHRDGMLKLLGCAYEREAVQAALAQVGGRDVRDGSRRRQARRHHDALARRMGGAPAGPARWRSCRCSRSPASARPPPARCRPPGSGRCRASACSTSRASSPARCAAARLPRTAPTSCASRRRTCRAFPLLDIDTGRGKLSAGTRPARRGGARAARRPAARGARVRAGLSAGRDRVARLLARGVRRDPPRHRHRLAVGLRPRRSVGRHGAASTRWCRTPAASTTPRPKRPASHRAQGAAGPGARSRHRLPDGVRRDDGAGAQGARGRVVARARVAGADRRTG